MSLSIHTKLWYYRNLELEYLSYFFWSYWVIYGSNNPWAMRTKKSWIFCLNRGHYCFVEYFMVVLVYTTKLQQCRICFCDKDCVLYCASYSGATVTPASRINMPTFYCSRLYEINKIWNIAVGLCTISSHVPCRLLTLLVSVL